MPHMLIIELWLLKWWHQVVFCCLTTTMWEDSPSLPKFFVYIPSIYLHRLLFCKHESSSYTSVYRLWCILYFWQHISLGLFNRFHSTELWIYLSLETIIDDVLKLMVQQAVNTGENVFKWSGSLWFQKCLNTIGHDMCSYCARSIAWTRIMNKSLPQNCVACVCRCWYL